jgi:tRNA U34 5-methylaminomethyl-2-thiouridine-forming methyltransferase MnmC
MLQPVPTADGSLTLYSPQFNQWYHSVHGALEESRRVFLELGFDYVAAEKRRIRVLEMGFGTGLNTLLTEQAARRTGALVHYTALEAFPIDDELVRQLNFGTLADAAVWPRLHEVPWETDQVLSPNLTLLKRRIPLETFLVEPAGVPFDLVYYDAFAPSSQPELWTPDLFAQLARRVVPGGVLTTYCSKGDVRRALQAAGFRVEKHPGPGRKREVVRGVLG